MVQIAHGKFSSLRLLAQQIQDTVEANELGSGAGVVSAEVVELAAQSMYLGA